MTASVLNNAALAAWIKTFPVQKNLEAYLETVPSHLRSGVALAVDAAFQHTDVILDHAASIGPVEMAVFTEALDQGLRTKFDWIDSAGLSALRSYVDWYAWHEGYAAK